jgi:hypothetical protein
VRRALRPHGTHAARLALRSDINIPEPAQRTPQLICVGGTLITARPGGLGHETLMKPVRLSDLVAAVEGSIGKVLVS